MHVLVGVRPRGACHRRFAFPIACFALALVAVPLGAQPRRGGRAAAALTRSNSHFFLLLALCDGGGTCAARYADARPRESGSPMPFFSRLGLALLPRMESSALKTGCFAQ